MTELVLPAFIFSLIAVVFSLLTTVLYISQKLSTHKVEYLPRDQYEALRKQAVNPSIPPTPELDLGSPEQLKKLEKEFQDYMDGFMNFQNGTSVLEDRDVGTT